MDKPRESLRRGWTTGACATAAAKAAYTALITGIFPDPIKITLPNGQYPSFALAKEAQGEGYASASIIKDAGDDPDVTHGALVTATVRPLAKGTGIRFKAGPGVGVVTKPGLPLPPGEPAINPTPRAMIRQAIAEVIAETGASGDAEIEVSINNGEVLAKRTWNPRLGIIGGLSILGTTGIVVPYSCSAWIHSIHQGIDVARATGLRHVAGCTGSTSEHAIQTMYGLPESAILDMGDFVGGLLKYLRRHPLPRLTIAGGFGKMVKLAQGHLDLHSGRSQVDFSALSQFLNEMSAPVSLIENAKHANSAMEILHAAKALNIPLANYIAEKALQTATQTLAGSAIEIEVIIFDRAGILAGQSKSHVA